MRRPKSSLFASPHLSAQLPCRITQHCIILLVLALSSSCSCHCPRLATIKNPSLLFSSYSPSLISLACFSYSFSFQLLISTCVLVLPLLGSPIFVVRLFDCLSCILGCDYYCT
ncbi:hypothetical protein BJY00DRAFT_246235 [Aspergillus carlsbadensis]|nr:hypothetical protein BJY00DRAFT_246235 [Aspergillus carlsbadensis]